MNAQKNSLLRTDSRKWPTAIACGIVAACCCACSSTNGLARRDSQADRPVQAIFETPKSQRTANPIQPLAHQSVQPSEPGKGSDSPSSRSTAGTARIAKPKAETPTRPANSQSSGIQQVGFSDASEPMNGQTTSAGNGVQTASYQITGCPCEPRTPALGPNPFAPGLPCEQVIRQPSPERFPDEYLCDGGDRGLPVHYDDYSRFGLETEDTVVEYTNHHGKERMRPSNKVCIYAPRFAAVRSISGTNMEQTSREIAGLSRTEGNHAIHTRLSPDARLQNVPLSHMKVRSRVSGLDADARLFGTEQVAALIIRDKVQNVYQNMMFLRIGAIQQDDLARLNLGIQAAVAWSRDDAPMIAATTRTPIEQTVQAAASTIVLIDDRENDQVGELRIIKLADKKVAQPNEIVEFTIRYDNLGPREVHDVRIVDNLTPRLEYVDQSAQSDRGGQLRLLDNGEGSVVLTFELSEPLPGRTGGVITFKARVR